MYAAGGYRPPWTGYVAVEDGHCVGACAFKSAPDNGRVEIAYFTFPENEGRGVASRMTRLLIKIAREQDNGLVIAAQTLPEESASTSVLRRNGFAFTTEVEHPEDGIVWEWRLEG
jgi:[ribosomal protein S5]-alanine N-acetyltransferase